ncbi:CHAT domain-containing protein [Syntrophus gentianae]|uniref:CHAT domain-containing protein n=1 Tax=Syntrophus gentianae TaxID=43775 RepID=A0A1H7WBJ7_9BACT|nr:CHAT domain-containing protein [Syntrophus gentianae]SEM18465.1 CHAT domain-containing protein [Syntrophus gentianae]
MRNIPGKRRVKSVWTSENPLDCGQHGFLRSRVLFVLAILMTTLMLAPGCATSADSQAAAIQKRAIQRIENYLEHFRKTGDQKTLLPELHQAERELFQSLNEFQRSGKLPDAALCLIKLGDIQRMQNQWANALGRYQEGEKLARQSGHRAYQAKAFIGQARTEFLGLREYGNALSHAERAIELSNEPVDLFNALDLKAEILIAQGQLIPAFDTLSRAFSIAQKVDDQTSLLYAYLDRADIYLKFAEKCDYDRTFQSCYEALARAKEDYSRALAIAQDRGYQGLAGYARSFLRNADMRKELISSQERSHALTAETSLFHPRKPGDVLVSDKFLSTGLDFPPGLLAWIQQSGVMKTGDARSFYIEGLLFDMQGHRDSALQSYLKAVELLERDRRRLRDEQSRGTFFEDKIEFYYTPILHLLERGRQAEAFDLMERSRSRGMADLLANKSLYLTGDRDQALYGAVQKAQAEIARLQTNLFLENSRPDTEQSPDVLSRTGQELKKTESAYRLLVDRLGREAPKTRSLVVSEPVSLKALQEAMKRDGYEVLQYLILEHGVILWHISGDAVHVRNVFLPRSELARKVGALRESLSRGDRPFDTRSAQELYLFLVQPARQWFKTNAVVVIPHEDLAYIPFQVFQNPADNRYLGEDFRITYAPSATVLASFSQSGQMRGTLLAVADPGIPKAQEEVQSIAGLFPGRSKVVVEQLARETDIKAWAGHYEILHLSAHGRFDAQSPLLSYVQLGAGGPDDGRLTAAEMFGLPLEKNRLVVLSACETGRARATHANEILGMTRALLYAGAKALVLSSWEVDSASTALWMETFYREAREQPLNEAARRALVAVKANPQYGHPYFWGAFTLMGR